MDGGDDFVVVVVVRCGWGSGSGPEGLCPSGGGGGGGRGYVQPDLARLGLDGGNVDGCGG